jgi:hypothetical protein
MGVNIKSLTVDRQESDFRFTESYIAQVTGRMNGSSGSRERLLLSHQKERLKVGDIVASGDSEAALRANLTALCP